MSARCLKGKFESSNAEQHKQQIKCVNCDGNHTANYRGCATRKTYLEALEKQRKMPAVQQPSRVMISTHPSTSESREHLY